MKETSKHYRATDSRSARFIKDGECYRCVKRGKG